MDPILKNMEYCRITPIANTDSLKVGDPVFCKMTTPEGIDFFMVHMITMISDKGVDGNRWFQIGSTDGDIYGWTQDIYGTARGTGIFQKNESRRWWRDMTKAIIG